MGMTNEGGEKNGEGGDSWRIFEFGGWENFILSIYRFENNSSNGEKIKYM